MDEISEEPTEPYTRMCAIDIGKAGLVACVRIPHDSNPRRSIQEVREYATLTPALLEKAAAVMPPWTVPARVAWRPTAGQPGDSGCSQWARPRAVSQCRPAGDDHR